MGRGAEERPRVNSERARSALHPLRRNGTAVLPRQWTLLAACPEHLRAWTCAHSHAALTTAPAKQFSLQWRLQGLVLTTAGVFKSNGEFGCLHIFFPSLQKKTPLRYLMFAIENRKIMLLKTKSLFKVFRVFSGGLLKWEGASLLASSARLLFFPFFMHQVINNSF